MESDLGRKLAASPENMTLVNALRARSAAQGDQIAYLFLRDGDTGTSTLTYGELDRKARAIGAALQALGATGDRALLLYQPGLAYIEAFFGCLYAGVTAVPVYPPRHNRNLLRLQAILQDTEGSLVLSTSAMRSSIERHLAEQGAQPMRWVATDTLGAESEDQWQAPAISGDTLAFLQYTSGSTGTPKGVMLSHSNLLSNLALITAATGATPQDRVVSWLPPYHDMGLIGGILQPLYAGIQAVLMSPASFLQRPYRWLQAISAYRATASPAPNFAYDLCVRALSDEQKEQLDLRSWKVALSGAEPIRQETLDRFALAFGPCGFQRDAFYPSYGLAEATLMASGSTRGRGHVVTHLARLALEQNRAVAAHEQEPRVSLIGCGQSLPSHQIVIAHPERLTRLAPGEVGEIWIAGPSVAKGYWNKPEATAQTFQAYLSDSHEGPFLRTGDLGFIDATGELFVTGRMKDLIIIRGRNLYPQDLEAVVDQSHPAVRPSCSAAFAIEESDGERLVIVTEVDRHLKEAPDAVIAAIRQAVAEEHEVQPHTVVLVRAASIPKTSSGKIQRHACKQAFITDALQVVASSAIDAAPAQAEAPALDRDALLALPAEERRYQLEQHLQAWVARALRLPAGAVDLQAPLTALGLDSLTGAELTASLETDLRISLSLATILQGPSIAELVAQVLAEIEHEDVSTSFGSPVHPLDPDELSTAYDLAYGQQALWFIHQLAPQNSAYNLAGAACIRSAVDIAALTRALQQLTERHPLLCAAFQEQDGRGLQSIRAGLPLALTHEEVSHWSLAQVMERLNMEAERAFALGLEAPMRLLLLTRSAQEHYLLLSLHHLIADFRSIALLINELGALYAAEHQGRPAALPAPALPYASFVRWQREMLASSQGEQHWQYWQAKLAGELPALNLPTDQQRPPIQTYHGATTTGLIAPELTERLKELARQQGVTLQMLLLATFQALLYRWTGQSTILVGSPMTGRSRAALGNVMGYLVNALPIRAELSETLSFTALLSQVQHTVLEAIEHQDYPFPLLVDRLQVGRDPSRPPLFQVLYTHQQGHLVNDQSLVPFALNMAGAQLNLGGMELESIELAQRSAQFDLSLTTGEIADGLAVVCQYNTDLFVDSTAKRLLGHFQTLLESVAANPERSVQRLPMLTAAEEQQALAICKGKALPYAQEEPVHRLFERQVERTPSQIAVTDGERRLTYRELNQRANCVAHYLCRCGVGPDVAVGIYVDRSVEMIVGLLGVLKAGGAYVPLDPSYPHDRLAYMLQDAGASILLTQAHLADGLRTQVAHTVCLDGDWPVISHESAENLPDGATAGNLAYIIYTSGSTGRPKGVLIEHRSLVNLLTAVQSDLQLTAQDTITAVTSFSFDVAQGEIFLALLAGASLVIAHREVLLDPARLAETIAATTTTLLIATPATWRMLLDAGWQGAPALRQVTTGEALPRELVAPLLKTGACLWDLYGPTETTIWSIGGQITDAPGPVLIGRPLANMQAYILDNLLQPVPIGVPGDLYIGGDGLARGYLNQPGITAERFVPDPFSTRPGARLYLTGDLARWTADGQIEFLGRVDHQVKIRGFRIELGEIEMVLSQHPAVRTAIVVAHEHGQARGESGAALQGYGAALQGYGAVLAAYVVPREGQEISTADLRAYLKQRLPEYMVPSFFVALEAMPLTPTGKIDRRALPTPAADSLQHTADDVAPRTAVEEALVAIWSAVLGAKQVGIYDNFFERGGHSLLAAQIVAQVRAALHVSLPLRTLFEAPTIAELAVQIETALRAGQAPIPEPVRMAIPSARPPLSFAQQRLWFMEQLQPGLATYHIPVAIRLTGTLHLSALEQSLSEIARRHETLRTTFDSQGSDPFQVVAAPEPLHLPPVDLTWLEPAAREAEALRLVTEEARQPFDLTRGPLLRAMLVKLSASEHILVLTMHHIISDGWSTNILVNEMALLYTAIVTGHTPTLPELPLQYTDFTHWQRDWLQGQAMEAQLAYWKQQLTGTPAVLELPTDRHRPPVKTYRGQQVLASLPSHLVDALNALSRENGATLFMTLLAAWQTLLHRYSGQEDICVGTPIASRNQMATQGLIGFFANTLVIRTDLSGNPTFRSLLARVRAVTLGAYTHQDLPFERIVDLIHPDRNLSYTPLFQVMFVLQNGLITNPSLPNLQATSIPVETGTAKFDLLLAMSEAPDGIAMSLEYSTDLFEERTAIRLLNQMRRLLEGVVANPNLPLSDLPILTAAEQQQILHEWNDTDRTFPVERTVYEIFEEQAERLPDHTAIIFEEQRLAYGEVNARANQLAHYLRGQGVGPDVLVGICFERSPEMVIAMLAVLKAGGAYLPLDPAYPKERLGYMLSDAQAPILISLQRLQGALPGHGVRSIFLDADAAAISREPVTNPARTVAPENLAYVIYTSGSTGRPKGVQIMHHSLTNLTLGMSEIFAITPQSRKLQFAPFSFDVAVMDCFAALVRGATLIMAPTDLFRDTQALIALLNREAVTIANFSSPAVLAPIPLDAVPTLQTLATGGEPLPAPIAAAWRRRVQYLNIYGPTEATIVTSIWMAPERFDESRPLPIGRPIPNYKLYILDRHLHPVPVGVPGELFIGGDVLARGYLNRPALTAERFIPDPFGTTPGGRLYRTGDLCQWLPEGDVEFLGRIDEQVKIRGFRIEVGEVEVALASHPAVADAVVVAREDQPGIKRLIAYITAASGESPSTGELRAYLARQLPEYMVPSIFMLLSAFPLTPNGKVDRRALPAPDEGGFDSGGQYVAPRTPVEELLAAIWSDVLRLQRVGIYDNFFESGGDSLLATRVVARIRSLLQIDISVRTLFEAPTVAALAQRVDAVHAARRTDARPIPQVERIEHLPLSFAQQRLWFVDQLQPGNASYIIAAAIRLQGDLHAGALEQSLREIIRLHESLRTTFRTVDGRPIQVIHPDVDFHMPLIDLRGVAPTAWLQSDVVRAFARRPFDLAHDLMLRATLLTLGDEEHVLLLAMHHIASDGWSMSVLIREAAALYAALSQGRTPELPHLPIQYADYAVWQREWLQGEVMEEQLSYWRAKLGNLPVLELPTDRSRPTLQSGKGAIQTLQVPAALARALKELSNREGVTLFMTLMAAFQTLLYRYSGQDDFGVGTPIASRNRVEVEELIGFFANTLVMRSNLSGNPTFSELLSRVRKTALEAYLHQDVPFERLVDMLQPDRSLGHHPLFQTLFVLQNVPVEPIALPGLTLSPTPLDSGATRFDLEMSLQENEQGLAGLITYSTDLFDAATIDRMTAHFQSILMAVVANPEQPITSIPLLTAGERQHLLTDCNNTAVQFARGQLIHRLVEEQVAKTPDLVAVRFGEASITYAELNRRANQLAHLLRQKGVGPERIVSICVERSFAMIIGVLAILKAGGAYLPLDPAYPQERLAYMLQDAGSPVLLTQTQWADKLPSQGLVRILLDEDADLIAAESAANLDIPVLPENPAYLIYTSGSTGRPKGISMPHSVLANLLHWERHFSIADTSTRTLQFTTLSFDPSFQEIFSALMTGGVLVLITEEMRLDLTGLPRLMQEEGIGRLYLPFVALQQVAEECAAQEIYPSALREVMTAGEQLQVTPALVKLFEHLPNCTLYNYYGPAECHVVTAHTLASAPKQWPALPPIGIPIANTQIYLLDAQMQPVPVGVGGELYIGGECVSRGYHEQPALTAERFVPDPFRSVPGARLYKTGDLCRWLPNGTIEFLGRIDQQVKIRGYRVEPGEVEAVLAQHPAVHEAAVVVQAARAGAKRLVGYIVPAPGKTLSSAELRAYLKQRMPDYMVPAAFVLLTSLPLTPTGKVDRRALPAPDYERMDSSAAHVPPRSPIEEVLAAIWGEVLGVGAVGVYDHFFEAGGHSLLATQVISRIRAILQVELPVRALFEAPTVAGLAAKVQAALQGGATSDTISQRTPPLRPTARTEPLPLSFAQQRLWFLDQLSAGLGPDDRSLQPGNAAYHLPVVVRLTGELQVTALEQSLQEIIRRHESLRTTFAAVDGRPVQVITPPSTFRLPITDQSTSSGASTSDTHALVRAFAWRPFDLTHDHMLRAMLIRLDAQEHLLVVVMHHIASDGWSIGVLLREIAALYQAFAAGQAPSLPELPIQYADYAIWQRQWLQGEALQSQLHYWKAQLANLTTLELPTDRPRPPVQHTSGAMVRLALPAELTQRLKQLSSQEGATLYMTLLAAFQTLLHRYAGQEDICVGSPIANRTQAETEDLIGFFVNTLVMRGNLSGNPRFRALLAQTRETALSAYRNQDLPFEQLVDALQPERSLNYHPLFQVMFILQNAPVSDVSLPNLRMSMVETGGDTAQFDLSLMMYEQPEGLVGMLNYNTDLFDATTIERMAGHWQQLLTAIADDPDLPLSELPILTAPEQQLLATWNATAAPYPQERCAHEMVENQAERTPDAIAVVYEQKRLTYRELNQRANQVAHRLRRHGVGPDTRVAIAAERSLEMVIGLLAILKAGGAYVPLDPGYPVDRLRYMLEDTAASVLLTQQHLVAGLPPHGAAVICLDADRAALEQESTENPQSGVVPENLAYVIYTSGSTGRPKGVQIRHRSLVNLLTSVHQAPGITPADTLVAVTSFSFDVATHEIFTPLTAGATLVIASRAATLDGSMLAELLNQAEATLLTATPATWRMLLAAGWQGKPDLRQITTGEALPKDLVAPLLQRGAALWNLYGPTETTIWSTGYQVTDPQGPVLIGRPIANTQVYILDKALRPVPVGVVGELFIGGDGLARGYLNQPELTAERFIFHPFDTNSGARLYRTGDLARYLPDGQIECLGRIDHQVKIRGFRIELGEIESVLAQHPLVGQAVVVARTDAPSADQEHQSYSATLIAYVVPATPAETEQSDATPSISELRAFLRQRLPEYMVPSAFVLLQALPLTPSGKVDRKALPAPEAGRAELSINYVAPRTPIEEILAAVWAEVLEIKQVGIHDNFFEMGGHSLLATQVIARLRKNPGVDLPLRDLFEAPTVAELAARVEAIMRDASAVPQAPIPQVAKDQELPLSFAQQRLWFIDQLQPGNSTFHIPGAFRLTGKLDVAALEASLREIVRRHESLRTTFRSVNGRPIQVIIPESGFEMPVIDLQSMDKAEREALAIQMAQEDARRPFNFAQDIMIRTTLLQMGPEEHILLLNMHHIATDGWSIGVLVRELTALYTAHATAMPVSLSDLPTQYADFAVWQRGWLQGDVLQRQIDYWKEALHDLPVLELPTDRPRPPVQTYAGNTVPVIIPAALAQSLRELTYQEGITLYMLLLALFQTLLHRYSGQEIISVGSPIANRTHTETEGMIGFFANMLVMRGDLSGDPSFRDLLVRTRQAALGAYLHQDLPFDKLVEVLDPKRSLSHHPLFQVGLTFQNAPMPPIHLPGLTFENVVVEAGAAKLDLDLFLDDTGQEISGFLSYNTDLFEEATAKRMMGHFKTLLESVVTDVQQPISNLPLLPPEERQELARFNATERPYDLSKCVHEWVEEQVERTPDEVAVIFEGHTMPYRELNRRANQLAHYLQKRGIGPDLLVAVCADRSFEVVIALLAVLKAGGAYVPIDPAYPPDRIAYMIEDTAASIILTQSHLIASLPKGRAEFVCLDTDWERSIAHQSEENPISSARPDNLAYVIYTSGSTGKPKGAMNEHWNICNRIIGMQESFNLQPTDRVVQNTAFSFDVSVWEFFWPLMFGAGLLMERPGGHQDTRYLVDLVRREKGTALHFVPVMLQAFLEEEGVEQCNSIKQVLSGGEGVTHELQKRFYQKLGHTQATLYHLYGPTEAAVAVTCWECERDTSSHVVPIGGPVMNTQIYIVDKNLREMPIGVPGELYIAGAQTGRGYWQRPDLTAEKFIPNPFSKEPGGRMYRTGDLARYLANGAIEFLGRIDFQVKIRGFRIELGEVEAAMLKHPAVRDVVAMAREDKQGGGRLTRRLVGYVAPHTGQPLTAAELRDFLKERLPDYMVPSAFVIMEQFPLNPNGKVDRKALPEPDSVRSGVSQAYVAPRDLLEAQLQQIWEEVLGIQPIGIHDNFFELGGHSLQAVSLMTRIRQLTGANIPLASLFQEGTIEQLAAKMRQQAGANKWSPLVPIQTRGERPPLFMIHPVGGNVLCYADLSRQLGDDQPVYGLQSRGLEGDQAPFEQIEEMATIYIAAMQTIQPQGPYHLGAWSLGAIVVQEMTKQLAGRGERVERMILIDPTPLVPSAEMQHIAEDEVGLLKSFINDWMSQRGVQMQDQAFAVQESVEAHIEAFLQYARGQNLIPDGFGIDAALPLFRVFQANLRAAARYQAEPVATNAIIFHAEQTDSAFRAAWPNWIQGEITAYVVPGDHFSIMQAPHLDALVQRLRQSVT